MSRRWSLWLGPPVALLAIALVLSRFQPGAEAGGRTTPPPAGMCADSAPVGKAVPAARGTWWRIAERLDGAGALAGKTLFAGKGSNTTLTLDLAAESSARGPVGGLIVVTNDDGRFSELRLISASAGCGWLIHRTDAVVRSALLDPSNGSILAHELERETRADRGVWRITGADPDAIPEQVLQPLAARADLGPIWITELRLDAKGRLLAVQSCGELACLTRVLTLGAGRGPAVIVGDGQGSMVGLAGGRLITWSTCPGMPCAIQAWDTGNGGHDTIVEQAHGAGVTGDGRFLVALLDPTGRAARVDVAGKVTKQITGIAPGDLPLVEGSSAYTGFEVGADELAIAAPGADAHAFNPGRAGVIP